MREYVDMFRPAYELPATIGWACGCLALMVLRPPFWPLLLAVAAIMMVVRARTLRDLWGFRLSLTVHRMPSILIEDLIRISRKFRKERASLYLGNGFAWGPREAEIAKQINDRNVSELPALPSLIERGIRKFQDIPSHERNFVYRAVESLLGSIIPKGTVTVKDSSIGVPWIHGIGAGQYQKIPLPLDALQGHTLFTGTTRAGKTRLYEMLSAQIIDMGSAFIVIDPKKDKDWIRRLRRECQRKGRKFLYFDVANPSQSIRINPLANWNNLSEPATRIGQLVDADGSFAAFAWKTLVRVQRGLVAAGEMPTIKNTKRYVQMGVEGLTETVLTKWFIEREGGDWDRDIRNHSGDGKQKITRLELMIAKYVKAGGSDDTIDGLIGMVTHSKEHFSKMIQVLEPILEMLGSDEVGQLLSPDPTDLSDTREIWDMRRILDERAVLYVGLDSLSNKIIASAIASILLADLASTLGAIYNFSNPTDAYLFVDEAAEVANDQLIQVLNKGGGAGIKVFLAAQAIADFVVRFASKDKAEQVLANLNNLISLRVRSMETAKYVSDLFSEIGLRSMESSFSNGAESSSAFTEFRSNISRSLKSEKAALVPPYLLTRLPPLHYFAFVAGRSYYKGCLDFIKG
jgi:conjugal transfer pilus assembly protein TraD